MAPKKYDNHFCVRQTDIVQREHIKSCGWGGGVGGGPQQEPS